MCRGIEEEEQSQDGSFRRSEILKRVVSARVSQGTVTCALCESRASLYCEADEAFLCRKCDKGVHGANFLAQRHIRCLLCNSCQGLTHRYLIGTSTEVLLPTIVSRPVKRSRCNSKLPFLFL